MRMLFEFIGSTIGAVIGGIFGIIMYVLTAIGMYRMAKNAGIKHAWFAWIPVLSLYLLGELINDKVFGIPYAKWILIIYPIVMSLLYGFTNNITVLNVLSIIYYIYNAAVYYKLFEIYKPNRALIYSITGIIITPLMALWIFLVRNNPRHAVN